MIIELEVDLYSNQTLIKVMHRFYNQIVLFLILLYGNFLNLLLLGMAKKPGSADPIPTYFSSSFPHEGLDNGLEKKLGPDPSSLFRKNKFIN